MVKYFNQPYRHRCRYVVHLAELPRAVVDMFQCALNSVQTSSKISPLLAYFVNFVSNGVSTWKYKICVTVKL